MFIVLIDNKIIVSERKLKQTTPKDKRTRITLKVCVQPDGLHIIVWRDSVDPFDQDMAVFLVLDIAS